MQKLTYTQQKEALTNSLKSFNIPEKYFIQKSDARLGKKFAIAHNTESGGLQVCTNFMTYEEMNCFLMGYSKAINKPL